MTQGLTGGEARAATDAKVNRQVMGTTVAQTKTRAQLETTNNPLPWKRQAVIATAVLKGAAGTTLPMITMAT